MDTRRRPSSERTRFRGPLYAVMVLLGVGMLLELAVPPATAWANGDPLTICSFNIKFLGHYKAKENAALAALVENCDIVLIQELVAPPEAGTYPDGQTYKQDPEASAFFSAMGAHFPQHRISIEDTGPNEEPKHANGTSTEWFVVFYKPDKVEIADDLPTRFIGTQRNGHKHYDRVPHAFGFRTEDEDLDFVLVNVHLHPDAGTEDAQRRKEELYYISKWVNDNDDDEKDFLIVGDMNIQDAEELGEALPTGYASLNAACVGTNCKGTKPYDHVVYRPAHTDDEIDTGFGFQVRNLLTSVPGVASLLSLALPDPLTYGQWFDYRFSDHNPILFRLQPSDEDN